MNISGDVKLNFMLMVNNKDYDNDDNPYGKFVLHQYTNMQNLNDTPQNLISDERQNTQSQNAFEDRVIPLKSCNHPIY